MSSYNAIKSILGVYAMGMIGEQLAQAIKYHQAGKLSQAAKLYQAELEHDQASDAALDGLGVVWLQLDQAEQSIDLIRKAIELHPSEHLYHYHLAEAYTATGRVDLSIDAYQNALKLCPDIGDYHFALGNALTETGRTEDAILAFKAALRYAPEDAEAHNNLANNLADSGQPLEAALHFEQALALKPDYADAHVNLARLHFESGKRDSAIKLCQTAISIQPSLFEAHLDLGIWFYQDTKMLSQALDSFQIALNLRPDAIAAKRGLANTLLKLDLPQAALPLYREMVDVDPVANTYLGISHCLIRLQQFSEAESMANKALKLSPDLAEAFLNLGVCLQTRGQFNAAKEAHHEALKQNPELTDAAYHLSILDPDAASSPGFKRSLQCLNEQQLTPEKQSHLHFALGKLAEREARYETAFKHFHRGNSIKAALYPFDEARHQAYIERIINTFTADFFNHRTDFGLSTESPIFIIGMPRSGSTLLEQILNSHSAIQGIGEHREMREMIQQIPQLIGSERTVPECISELSAQQSRELSQRYLDSLPESCAGTQRVADKMLGNFLRLGLIALLFPRSRVIHCRRQALDTCLSCYTQDFASGLRFTTDLRHLGIAYKSYLKLMAHWEQVLPLPILSVDYEDMVSNVENCTRQLIDFCGLPWDKACLQHHATKSTVATASFLQVRQPVYRKSVDKWKRYEQHLAPLIEALK